MIISHNLLWKTFQICILNRLEIHNVLLYIIVTGCWIDHWSLNILSTLFFLFLDQHLTWCLQFLVSFILLYNPTNATSLDFTYEILIFVFLCLAYPIYHNSNFIHLFSSKISILIMLNNIPVDTHIHPFIWWLVTHAVPRF